MWIKYFGLQPMLSKFLGILAKSFGGYNRNHPNRLTHKFSSTISENNREKERKHERGFRVRGESTRRETREREVGLIPCVATCKDEKSSSKPSVACSLYLSLSFSLSRFLQRSPSAPLTALSSFRFLEGEAQLFSRDLT
jgi:hypothetical protein